MNIKEILFGKKDEPAEPVVADEPNDHEAPEHLDPEGPEKGWSAADLSEDELVDDDWIAKNVEVL